MHLASNRARQQWLSFASEEIATLRRGHGVSQVGAAQLALSGIHDAQRLIRAVREDIARFRAPVRTRHAIEDDFASTLTATLVAEDVGSERVRTIFYQDSCHILTNDHDKESVADEAVAFFRGTADAAVRRPGGPVRSDEPKHLLVA